MITEKRKIFFFSGLGRRLTTRLSSLIQADHHKGHVGISNERIEA